MKEINNDDHKTCFSRNVNLDSGAERTYATSTTLWMSEVALLVLDDCLTHPVP